MKRLSIPLIVLGAFTVAACQQTALTSSTPTVSVINRANEMQNVLNFDACLSNGLEQDAQAAASDEPGQYLASADTLGGCDSQLRDWPRLSLSTSECRPRRLPCRITSKVGISRPHGWP